MLQCSTYENFIFFLNIYKFRNSVVNRQGHCQCIVCSGAGRQSMIRNERQFHRSWWWWWIQYVAAECTSAVSTVHVIQLSFSITRPAAPGHVSIGHVIKSQITTNMHQTSKLSWSLGVSKKRKPKHLAMSPRQEIMSTSLLKTLQNMINRF